MHAGKKRSLVRDSGNQDTDPKESETDVLAVTGAGPPTGGLTCEGAGGDVQPRSHEEVGPHVLQVAVDEGGVHLEHLKHGCRFLLPGGAPDGTNSSTGWRKRGG